MDAAMRADLVRRIAAPRVGWDAAEDVVQEACWRALRRYGPEALENGNLMGRIVARMAIDWWRLESRRRHVPLEPWHGGTGDPEREALTRVALDEALGLCQGRPIPLLLALGYTTPEIGAALDVPRATVKTKLFRQYRELRAERTEELP
jgi:DNA-directed RNA polymerase specialized sigma24 family protein